MFPIGKTPVFFNNYRYNLVEFMVLKEIPRRTNFVDNKTQILIILCVLHLTTYNKTYDKKYTGSLDYLAHIVWSLHRPFSMVAGSVALTAVPVCRDWGPRIL
jgi:hypothetical protein